MKLAVIFSLRINNLQGNNTDLFVCRPFSSTRGEMVKNWGSLPMQWLVQQSKSFLVNGNNIKILYQPNQFFKTLKDGISRSRHRVMFSSLYLGTGSKENELVDCFHQSLSDVSRRDLKVTLLLDHLRGSRGHRNSRTMVQPLIPHFRDRFTLGLYHTPNLRGILKALCPERFNEVMGLQHMKIYLFDDDVLISGANLSSQYFETRQDRYVLFKDCKNLADFFSDVINTTLSHSFTLNTDGSTTPPSALTFDPLSSNRTAEAFKQSLGRAIKKLTVPSSSLPELTPEGDTIVCPLLQMGFCGVTQDQTVTLRLMETLRKDDTLYLASGYFNLPPVYSGSLLNSQGTCNVLAASAQANGFYGARGVAGHVPVMYNHFARQFLEDIVRTGSEEKVHYWEYQRPGWTFHGKGVWYYPGGEEWPSATFVGSSNYGHRSLTHDLEAQVAVVTRNPELRRALHEEKTLMFDHANHLTLNQVKDDPTKSLTVLEHVATTFLKPHV